MTTLDLRMNGAFWWRFTRRSAPILHMKARGWFWRLPVCWL